jgi:hypothetical protein
MTSYAAKLGALVAAGALIATAAIPAYSDLGAAAAVPHRAQAIQSVAFISTAELVSPSRDGYSVTKPRRVSAVAAVAGDLVYWPGQHIGIYDGAGGMYNSPRPGRYVEHVGSLWGSPLFIRLTA